jgi:hydroxyacylglutathione hydrolase
MNRPVLDVQWIHGSPPGGPADPVIQVHTVDDATFILRQSKDVNYEAPFLYLLCGTERALLLDTGAVADGGVREAIDSLLSERRAGAPGYQLVVRIATGTATTWRGTASSRAGPAPRSSAMTWRQSRTSSASRPGRTRS